MMPKNDRAAWLKGGNTQCAISPQKAEKPYRLVLLGAPGIGKGTQAELLCGSLQTCHLSTGDIFRASKSLTDSERSPALAEALEFMKRGDLVPDKTVLDMVRERVRCLRCPGGFLLDGFPRTVPQAEALTKLLEFEKVSINGVLDYQLPIEQVVARLAGRRTCGGCKAVFHVSSRPPKVADVCDHCQGKLFQREDDRPEAIRVRMEAYARSTAPLTEYYRKLGLLIEIQADGGPEAVLGRSLKALGVG